MRVMAEADGGNYMITDYPEPERAFTDIWVEARVLIVVRREISAQLHPMSITKSSGWRPSDEKPPDLENWLREFDWHESPERRQTKTEIRAMSN